MTGPDMRKVGVLRLLDEVADCAYVPMSRDDLTEARAAVAELVEAGRELNAAIDEATEQIDVEAWMSGERVHRARDRHSAALARMEGAK